MKEFAQRSGIDTEKLDGRPVDQPRTRVRRRRLIRPISILPLINKLLERHIHKLILDHFASSLPISPR